MVLERLSAEDARILALESGHVRGHTCKTLVVEGDHSADDVRAHLERRIGSVPRLRQRLAPTPLRVAPPAWVDDPAFSLERHVHERSGELRAVVGELMSEPLDRERPLWTIHVVPLADDHTALVTRLHHCMADGQTAMSWVTRLFLDSERQPSLPRAGEWAPARPPSRAHLLGQALRFRLRGSGGSPHWGTSVRALAAAPPVLRRELAGGAQETPLDRPAGPHREVAFISVGLDEVKRIGHSCPVRGTVNDVLLAAVAGGLRRWLLAQGEAAETLRVKVPVCLHRSEDTAANRDSFMVVDLALEEHDPVARLADIAGETHERKEARDADELDELFRDVAGVSERLERHAERWANDPRVYTLSVSNVPGPQGELWVMGSPLRELHALAEIANRHALRVAAASAGGRLSIGFCADADAVAGVDGIARGVEDELAALGRAL